MDQKILHKTLIRKWFEMIESGEKKEEYLDIKPYWCNRLLLMNGKKQSTGFWKGFTHQPYDWEDMHTVYKITFRYFDLVSANNGYQKDCPNIKWVHKGIRIGTGREEWGALPGKQYFILEIGELINLSQTPPTKK